MNVNNFIPSLSSMPYVVREVVDKVTKVVMNYSDVEVKVLDATNDDNWGPHGKVLQEIANLTCSSSCFQEVMGIVWKRLMSTNITANPRRVYKTLTLLMYLLKHGSTRVLADVNDHLEVIKFVRNAYSLDSNKHAPNFANVIIKVDQIVRLVNDEDELLEERIKASELRKKHIGNNLGSDDKGAWYGGQIATSNKSEFNFEGKWKSTTPGFLDKISDFTDQVKDFVFDVGGPADDDSYSNSDSDKNEDDYQANIDDTHNKKKHKSTHNHHNNEHDGVCASSSNDVKNTSYRYKQENKHEDNEDDTEFSDFQEATVAKKESNFIFEKKTESNMLIDFNEVAPEPLLHDTEQIIDLFSSISNNMVSSKHTATTSPLYDDLLNLNTISKTSQQTGNNGDNVHSLFTINNNHLHKSNSSNQNIDLFRIDESVGRGVNKTAHKSENEQDLLDCFLNFNNNNKNNTTTSNQSLKSSTLNETGQKTAVKNSMKHFAKKPTTDLSELERKISQDLDNFSLCDTHTSGKINASSYKSMNSEF